MEKAGWLRARERARRQGWPGRTRERLEWGVARAPSRLRTLAGRPAQGPEATALYTRAGAEVDFVLEVGRELWGIEVKAGRQVSRRMLRGLASLSARSNRVKRRIVVYCGDRPQVLDGVDVLPVGDFLKEI